MRPPRQARSRRRPTPRDYVRRRTVGAATAAAILFAVVTVMRGDPHPTLEAAAQRLVAAQQALLPWRAVISDGSAGVLDSRGLPGPAAQQAAVERYLALGLPIFCSAGRGRFAALTFDDGPSRFSDRVLALLHRAGAQATFFLIGRQVGGAGDIPRRQLAQGAVGDHTWNHAVLTRVSARERRFEVGETKRVLEQALRRPVTLFRSPYESHNAAVDAEVRSTGLLQVLWNVDTRDSDGAGTEAIVRNAQEGLAPGAIILLHETYDRSVAALPRILAAARARHLRLVSVPELLALDPPSDAQVRALHGGCDHRQDYRRAQAAGAMRLRRDGVGPSAH